MAETIAIAQPTEKPPARGIAAHPIKFVVFLIVLAAAAIGGSRMWTYLDSFEGTDDAQIDGDFYPVTSRIAGTIKGVYVDENAHVKAGQLLAEIDPADYDMAVTQAKAALHQAETEVLAVRPNVPLTDVTTETTITSSGQELANARAQLAAAQREYESSQADIRGAEADAARAQGDLAKYKQLVDKDEISRQEYDRAVAVANSFNAQVDSKKASSEAAARNIEAAQARLQMALTKENEASRTRPQQIALQNALVASRQATVEVNRARLAQAELNLSYTKVLAPIDGIVGRKSVATGQQVAAGEQLMVDVPQNRLWVTANFKETQLKRIHVGQRAEIHVDAYDRDFEGTVADFAGASGARFSLLPPENATGNYVKVVQRLPVRLWIKEGQDPEHLLRPGMSVDAKVWLDKAAPDQKQQ
jgi:membrane fusion protein (multidrug efflux system)